MFIDWSLLATARGLQVSAADLDRMVPVLKALDAAFSPLAGAIRHETEPAIILSLAAVSGLNGSSE